MINGHDGDGDGIVDTNVTWMVMALLTLWLKKIADDTDASINPSAEEEPADGTDKIIMVLNSSEDTDGDGFGPSEIESPDFLCTAVGLSAMI